MLLTTHGKRRYFCEIRDESKFEGAASASEHARASGRWSTSHASLDILCLYARVRALPPLLQRPRHKLQITCFFHGRGARAYVVTKPKEERERKTKRRSLSPFQRYFSSLAAGVMCATLPLPLHPGKKLLSNMTLAIDIGEP